MISALTENGKKVLAMAEYINREYAVDAVLDVYYDTPDIDLSGEKFEAAIRKIQAADVAPVRKGRWESVGLSSLKCSDCGYLDDMKMYHRYCPDCGCFMR